MLSPRVAYFKGLEIKTQPKTYLLRLVLASAPVLAVQDRRFRHQQQPWTWILRTQGVMSELAIVR